MLYLQVHVIRKPLYNFLLGRPFNVLMVSIIKKFQNEDQTITIQDLNSGRVMTIPMFRHGLSRHHGKSVNF